MVCSVQVPVFPVGEVQTTPFPVDVLIPPLPSLDVAVCAVSTKRSLPNVKPRQDIDPEVTVGISVIGLQFVPPSSERSTVPELPAATIMPFPQQTVLRAVLSCDVA